MSLEKLFLLVKLHVFLLLKLHISSYTNLDLEKGVFLRSEIKKNCY